jgi:lipopolysaccharide/colanic/teichoic acid biosynthesis glycosyltransferase
VSYVANLPQRQAGVRRNRLYRVFFKRAIDIALLIALAAPFAIVIALLALAVRRDGGPAFFGHKRVGQNGRMFRCWKLRTMVPNAEEVLIAYLAENPEAAKEWAMHVKLHDDPRVTRLGRFLRATSLDELPQLWNVFVGDMTFVGPRPVTLSEMEKYAGHEQSYLSLRPGITGLWQVSGRNDTDYGQRVRLDSQYYAICSLRQDFLILFRTFGAVLRRTGK